jgi:hypothetical protein
MNVIAVDLGLYSTILEFDSRPTSAVLGHQDSFKENMGRPPFLHFILIGTASSVIGKGHRRECKRSAEFLSEQAEGAQLIR